MKNLFFPFLIGVFLSLNVKGAYLLMPMDASQTDHLKAYGITYWALTKEVPVDWLLNYRGGSFLVPHSPLIQNECLIRNVSFEVISDAQVNQLFEEIASPSSNMDVMKLEQYPKIAVYSPKSKQPWDDAVTLVLSYAEIPYEIIFDDEIMYNELIRYDWLHLHHEDFTGQYGRFYKNYKHMPWYQQQQNEFEASAQKHGYGKVSLLKLAIAKRIKSYVASGGFLFAMCSATDTYDIALAAEGLDICEKMYDGDPMDPTAQSKLDFERTFAFENFQLVRNPYEYEFSNIDNSPQSRGLNEQNDYFTLFQFSAKWDPIPTMLTQNHEKSFTVLWGRLQDSKKI